MGYDRCQGWFGGFEGVIAAVVTPFDSHGELDTAAVQALVEHQITAGVRALMVGGTTGEFVAMSEHERRRALEAFVETADGRVRIIAHSGDADLRAARRLTRHAAELGVDAIAAVTPYYFMTTIAAAAAYYRELAELVPQTAFFVYDFPRNTTNPFSAAALEELADIPNLVGAKCSVATFEELRSYLRLEPELRIVCGNDGLLPQFTRSHGRCIVSGTAAAYPELVQLLFTRSRTMQWGHAEDTLLADIVQATRAGAPDRLKHLLRCRGLDIGHARVRTYDPAEAAADGTDAAHARVERQLRNLVRQASGVSTHGEGGGGPLLR